MMQSQLFNKKENIGLLFLLDKNYDSKMMY